MGLIDSLRMNGLFGNAGGNSSQSLAPPIDGSPNIDAIARIINLVRGPMTQDRDANWNHENNLIAQEHNNKLAEIAKMSAAQNGSMEPTPPQNVVMAPSAISPLDKAKLDLQTADLNRKKEADKNNLGVKQTQAGINQQKADTSSYRADIYNFKTTHPNMQIRGVKGGNFVAIDPITGKSMDTGINTGTVSEDERLALTNSAALDQIDAKGTNAENLQKMRGTQQTSNIAARGAQTRETNAAKPVSNTPVQQNRDQMNKAREIKNTDPELGQFITIEPNGSFTVAQPSKSFFGGASGPTLEQMSRIQSKIYDKTSSTAKPKVPESPDPDYEYVPKPGGGFTAVLKKKSSDEDNSGDVSVADSTGVK